MVRRRRVGPRRRCAPGRRHRPAGGVDLGHRRPPAARLHGRRPAPGGPRRLRGRDPGRRRRVAAGATTGGGGPLVAVADLPVPVHDPARPRARSRWVGRRPRGGRAPLHAGWPAGCSTGCRWPSRGPPTGRGRAERRGQEQHRQRAPALLGSESRRGQARRDLRSSDLAQDDVRAGSAGSAQDAHLFPTTIAGEHRRRPARRDRGEIAEAARPAQLGPWIDSLPDGMDTPVGERGPGCPAASASGWPWPGPSWPGRRSWCSTSRRRGSTGRRPPAARRRRHHPAGTTVVYITHRDEELAPFDDVVVVEAGRVVSRSAP